MNARLLMLLFLGAACHLAAAQPHGGDVILTLDTSIRTNDENGPQRVFASEMGELLPDFTDEPGFDNAPGTFPVGTSIGFDVLDALRIWNGADFDQVSPARMEVAFSTLSRTTPEAPAVVAGFSLPVGSNGEWHRHLEFTLLPPAGSGVYLIALSLWSSDPTIGASEPFWIVFNNGADEPTHDAAMDWVRAHLLPPACDPDLNQDGNADQDDVLYLVNVIGGGDNPAGIDPDFNHDGNADQDDISALIDVVAGGTCP